MEYDYKILKIELENLDDGCGGSNLCVRATVKTKAGTADILEWVNVNYEEDGYNLEETDKNDNDLSLEELFPELDHKHWAKDCQVIALAGMWRQIEEWVGKQGLL